MGKNDFHYYIWKDNNLSSNHPILKCDNRRSTHLIYGIRVRGKYSHISRSHHVKCIYQTSKGLFLVLERTRKCECEEKNIEERLEKKIEENIFLRNEALKLESSISKLKSQIASLSTKGSRGLEQCEKAKHALEEKLLKKSSELDQKQKEIEELSAKISSLEHEKIRGLEAQLQKMASDSQARILEMKEQIDRNLSDIERIQVDLGRVEGDKQKCHEELGKASQERRKLQIVISEEKQKCQTDMKSMMDEKERLDLQISLLQSEKESLFE